MEAILEFFESLYNPEKLTDLIRSGGYLVLAAIVFAETGLFIGFFLPGDSLLFLAGLVAAKGFFDVTILMVLLSVMAIVGDAVGYGIGFRAGVALYKREDSFWFRKKHLHYAREFYERHGGKAIVLARFVPFARTFAPVVAGIGQMSYPRFAAFNVFGGIFWVVSMVLAGYYLGQVAWIRDNLEKVVLLIVFLSITPILFEWARHRFRERAGRSPDRQSPPS
ncbi:MAG: VTT domain-containing protein [Acidobacteria bacterium]|nr:VTT domain-containing protein [Acidobacteriota bacterium]